MSNARRSLESSFTAGDVLASALTMGVFLLDWVTPLGYAVPILYLVPLALVGRRWWEHGIYWFAGGATCLSVLGIFVGPEGGWMWPALFNRAASVLVIWGAAVVLSSEKRAEWKLMQEAELNRAILDAVAVHITLLDRHGDIIERDLGSEDSAVSGVSPKAGFVQALRSPQWETVKRRSAPCDATDPDQYLAGVWDVVRGYRSVYSTEYGRLTPSGYRWFLLYAKAFTNREGAVVAHIDMTERREVQDALQKREREVQLLIDARESLARDLHDEVIQRLYGLGLKLMAWRKRAGEAGLSSASRFGEIIYDIDQVIRQVRGYIEGTGAAAVDGKQLPQLTEELIASMVKDVGVAANVAVDSDVAAQLNPEQAAHMLAMIREAVSNALQHAHASRVSVCIMRMGDAGVLQVEDDGCGFDPAEVRPAARGLANLRARAARLQGLVDLRSAPGQGTRVRLQFPLEARCEVR